VGDATVQQESVLIVEDMALVALDIRKTLEHHGYTVTAVAHSGEDAVASVRAVPPDFILMDIVLAGRLDGIETARIIRDEVGIRSLFLTSHGTRTHLKNAMTVAPLGYLLKPFNPEQLLASVEVALRQVRTDKELDKERQLMRSVLAHIPDPVALKDVALNYQAVNPAFCRLAGTPAAAILGTSDETLFSAERARHRRELEQSVLQNGSPVTEEESKMLGAHQAWFTSVTAPVFAPDETVNGLLVLWRDITEHVLANQRVLQSELRLRTLFEGSAVGIFELNPAGKPLRANPACSRLLGFESPGQLESETRNVRALLDDASGVVRVLSDALARNSSAAMEVTLRRRDGELFSGDVRLQAVRGADGKLEYVFGFVQDITARAAVEAENEKRRQTAHRRHRLSVLGELAAGVAHEIGQPLTGISMTAEEILFSAMDGTLANSDGRSKAEEILEYVERISAIIDHVRSFSRGDMESRHELFSLNNTVAHALLMVRSQYEAHGISVGTEFADELPAVYGAQLEVEQVILNLLSNSRYAVERHFHNRMEEKAGGYIALSTYEDEEMVVCEILDNGMGIHPDQLKNVFSPFYTTKPPGEGTGLGLAISLGIAQELGGTIQIESEPGAYTVARLRLPRGEHA